MISRGRESEKEKTLPEVGHFSVCLPSTLLWNNGIHLDIEIDGERKNTISEVKNWKNSSNSRVQQNSKPKYQSK